MRVRGQGIIDYVFMMLVIVAVLLIMGYYIRNSLSGKWRQGADVYGEGQVYEPR
jgi:hypothetical protein